MRRTLMALVLFSATLFMLQYLPEKTAILVRRTDSQDQKTAQWVQTTSDEFESGELDCLVLETTGDGELVLDKEPGGDHCPSGVFVSRIQETPVLFNVVGSAWQVERPMGTTFQLELRVSGDGAQWGDWIVVTADEDGPGSEPLQHGNLVEVAPSRYVQYRLTLGTFEPRVSPLVREIVLTFMNTREGPTIKEALAMIIPQEVTSGVPQPRIISRRGWGANEAWATREPVYQKPTHFVIHHTVTTNDPQDPAYIVRAVYQYHAVSRGWGDIGYNFLIDRQGNIYEGRKGGDGVVGVHSGDYNYGSIGIALLGDYRTAEMTPAMKEALVSLIAWQSDRFGINPTGSSHFVHRTFPHIVGHRDLWTTVCPGDKVYRALGELRQLGWQRLLSHNPRVRIVSPDAGRAVSGDVEVRITSPSPTTKTTQLLLDGSVQAEGESTVVWRWNTRQYAEGVHTIEAVATTAEGRTSKVAREVAVDNTLPTGAISINNGTAYTSQLTVTLALRADDGDGEIEGMQFTKLRASEFSEIEEFASEREWSLGSGDGQKTVGVRFVDWADNVSPTYTASIILDTTPPGDWGRVGTQGADRVMVGVTDQGSGLDPASARYSLSRDGGFNWGSWQNVDCDASGRSDPVAACYLEAEVLEGAVRFRILDRAGNEAYSPMYGEVLASPTPEPAPPTDGQPTPEPTPTPDEEVPPAELPDLVVDKVVIAPPANSDSSPLTVTATIRNDASVEVPNGFWVGLFVDPEIPPVVNSVAVLDGHGALWYVPGLAAHEARTLSIEDMDDRYSSFSGRLSEGRHDLYVYVDAYNTEGEVGLVAESDESNNLLGPLLVEVSPQSGDGSEPEPPGPADLLRLLIQRLERYFSILRQRL